MYGLGLRASDPVTRDKFYKLWNNAIPPSLFERLKHVIMGQNWEEMGNTFWLKQAVVRHLYSPQKYNCYIFISKYSLLHLPWELLLRISNWLQ